MTKRRSTAVSSDVEFQVRLLVRNSEEDDLQREWWIGKLYRSHSVPKKGMTIKLPEVGPKIVTSLEEEILSNAVVNCVGVLTSAGKQRFEAIHVQGARAIA